MNMNNSLSFLTIYLTAKRVLIITLSFQLALVGLVCLNKLGLGIPLLRQVIAFICFTFVPGFLFLKILKISKLDLMETLLYSIGLSLSLLMFAGVLINFLCPLIGISNPLSDFFVLVAVNSLISTLIIICYSRARNVAGPFILTLRSLRPSNLILLFIPLSSILGTYFLTFHDNNTLLLACFVTISLIPVFVASDKFPKEAYPYAILLIALSLVLYNSLFGIYMRPTDNIFEFYFLNRIIENECWNVQLPSNLNAMPGIMILIPIFHYLSRMSLTWIYKAVVPLLSSFIPFGLYKVFQRRADDKTAFLSCFFFLSIFAYFTWASITMKMVSAGFFLMLILLTGNSDISEVKKATLILIFSLSLIWSHYGTSYWFMFSSISALLTLFTVHKNAEKSRGLLNPTFVLLYIVMALSWFMYVTKGSIFEVGVLLVRNIIHSIATEFLFPSGTWGTYALTAHFSFSIEILRVLYIIAGLFIAIGLILTAYEKRGQIDEYLALSFPFFILLVSPYITVSMYAGGRSWYIGSFLLAPFCILGAVKITRIIKKTIPKKFRVSSIKVVSVFLTIFLLFNTGVVSAIILKDSPGSSIYLSKARIQTQGNLKEKEYFDRVYLSVYDISGSKWLEKYRGQDKPIGIGRNSKQNMFFSNMTFERHVVGSQNCYWVTPKNKFRENSYIYLSEFNVKTGKIKIVGPRFWYLVSIDEFPSINSSDKIYTNGGSEIYYR